jgi:Fe-S cluster biogenesis protein NfuA
MNNLYVLSVHATPNPNACKWVLSGEAMEWGAYEWSSCDRPTRIPPVDAVLELAGVERVYWAGDFVTVVKSAEANWETLMTPLRHALNGGLKLPLPPPEMWRKYAIAMPHDERGLAEWMAARVLPATEKDGGGIFFVGTDSDLSPILRPAGACKGCPYLPETVEKGILGGLIRQKNITSVKVV